MPEQKQARDRCLHLKVMAEERDQIQQLAARVPYRSVSNYLWELVRTDAATASSVTSKKSRGK